MIQKILLTLSLLIVSPVMAAVDCENEEHYPQISKSEIQTLLEQKKLGAIYTVDVNSKSSFEKHHIGNAIHYGSHKKDFAKKLPKDKDALIVAYCGGPSCTAWQKAAKEACKQGYTNVKHYKGGIKGWVKN